MATTVAVATMKSVQVPRPGADFQVIEREIPEPAPGQVRIKVQACGVCHSDAFTKEGSRPGIQYPRVPGHEVVGLIDKAGVGVSGWTKSQRVGVGWHGGHDGTCRECRRGDFRHCRNRQVPRISYDGGYGQYMVAPVQALVPIPETLSDVEAAPLLCAGTTTFDALRRSGAAPGDLVAVQGVGGLGHLGIQFASKFGCQVAAIGLGTESGELAKKLGASLYIDSKATNAAEALQQLGGARGHPGDRSQREGDVPVDRRSRTRWEAYGHWGCPRAHSSNAVPAHRGQPINRRLRLRHDRRYRGHAPLRRADRCPSDDRDLSPRAGGAGVRPNDEWKGEVPSGSDDVIPRISNASRRQYDANDHDHRWNRDLL